jgi:predicted phage terminase large subunit-like protein
MKLEQQHFDSLIRTRLSPFIHKTFQTLVPAQEYQHNWHIDALAWHLEQCAAGKITRLLITLPPRNLKSICASVAFPAWLLGRDPSRRLLCASYSADLAGKHASDCRAVMESAWYRRVFPHTRISREKNTEMNFVTNGLGYRYSTSVGGTVTGRGGDMLIIDDPLKAEDAMSEIKRAAVNHWYDNTLYSRLDDKRRGVIILIMQRLHLEDLAGHVLEQEPWVRVDLPAIAESDQEIQVSDNDTHYRRVGDLLHEQREPLEVLEKMKVALGSYMFSAQYQQNPVPVEGSLIKSRWFHYYDQTELASREPGDEIVQSWDTAFGAKELNDYSVCSTWLVRRNQYFLIDILRKRLTYPDLKRTVIMEVLKYRPHVLIIENRGSGMSLIDDLSQASDYCGPLPIAFDPEGDKIERLARESAKIEAGQVMFPRKAPFLDDFRSELLQFPHGRHDDQVDSLSQFLAWVGRRGTFSWDFGQSTAARVEFAGISTTEPAPPQVPGIPPRILIADPKRGLIPQAEFLALIEKQVRGGPI